MASMVNKIVIGILIVAIVACGFFITADLLVEKSTDGLVYSDASVIPYNRVGLLLGTAQYVKVGRPNQYFVKRIEAAVELFRAHKIDYIVVSGDNQYRNYNEPRAMQKALILKGIPKEKIYLDHAGLRTYDSVVRINKIFGQTSFTVISQEFQNRRAIYIAKHFGWQAIGYDAKDVTTEKDLKVKWREKISRVVAIIDVLIDRQPKFLGPKITI